MLALDRLKERVSRWRRSGPPAEPPSWKINALWLLGSLVAAWTLGFALTKPASWLWNLKITVTFNCPGVQNVALPPFSGWLFAGSALLLSIFYLAPHYLLHATGSWARYMKQVCWQNLGLYLGLLLCTAAGSLLAAVLASIPAMKDVFAVLNQLSAGIEVKLPYAGDPLTVTPSVGTLLGLALGIVLVSRRRRH